VRSMGIESIKKIIEILGSDPIAVAKWKE